MSKFCITPELHTSAVTYCEALTQNPPVPRPDYPATDPINTGRYVISTSKTPLASGVSLLCDQITQHIPELMPIPETHPYPHSFSVLWYTGNRTTAVHRHTDPAGPLDLRHVRILFLLSETAGGDCGVHNRIIQAKPPECWAIWADSQLHWSTPVAEPGVRTV